MVTFDALTMQGYREFDNDNHTHNPYIHTGLYLTESRNLESNHHHSSEFMAFSDLISNCLDQYSDTEEAMRWFNKAASVLDSKEFVSLVRCSLSGELLPNAVDWTYEPEFKALRESLSLPEPELHKSGNTAKAIPYMPIKCDTSRMYTPSYQQHTVQVSLQSRKVDNNWINFIQLSINQIPFVTSLLTRQPILKFQGFKFSMGWQHKEGTKAQPVIRVQNGGAPINTGSRYLDMFIYTSPDPPEKLPANAIHDSDDRRLEWQLQSSESRWNKNGKLFSTDYEWGIGDVFLSAPEDSDDAPAMSHDRTARVNLNEYERMVYESADFEFSRNGNKITVLEKYDDWSLRESSPHLVLPPTERTDRSDYPLRGFEPSVIDSLLKEDEHTRERLSRYLDPQVDGLIWLPAKILNDQRDADKIWIHRQLRNRKHYSNSRRVRIKDTCLKNGNLKMILDRHPCEIGGQYIIPFYNHYKTIFDKPEYHYKYRWQGQHTQLSKKLLDWANKFVDHLNLVTGGNDNLNRFYLNAIKNREMIGEGDNAEDPVKQVMRIAKGLRELDDENDDTILDAALAGQRIPISLTMMPSLLGILQLHHMNVNSWLGLFGYIYLELEHYAEYTPPVEVLEFQDPADWLTDYVRGIDPFYHLVMRKYNGDKDIKIEEVRAKLVEFYGDDTDPLSKWVELDSHEKGFGSDIRGDNTGTDEDRRINPEPSHPTQGYRPVYDSITPNQSWANQWSSRDVIDRAFPRLDTQHDKVVYTTGGPNMSEDTTDHMYHV